MSAKVGDRVVVEAERTTQAPRHGVIEEILRKRTASLPHPLGRRPREHPHARGGGAARRAEAPHEDAKG